MRLALIIPAHNEELCIAMTLAEYHRVFPHAEFYVIDNNSSDKTFQVAQKSFRDLNIKGQVMRERRQGKGFAVNYAFQTIEADFFIMTDADYTYPALAAEILLERLIEEQLDVAVGDRISNGEYLKHSSNHVHNFGNKILSQVVNMLFKTNTKDVFSGLRVFSRRFVKHCPLVAKGFELETEMTINALRYGFRIAEVPILFRERPQDTHSKLRTIADGGKILLTILKLLKDQKPLVFFGYIGSLFYFAAFLFAIMPVVQFIQHFAVLGVASAVVAVGFAILGTLIVLHGVTLHTVERNHIYLMNVHLKTIGLAKDQKWPKENNYENHTYVPGRDIAADQLRFGEEHLRPS